MLNGEVFAFGDFVVVEGLVAGTKQGSTTEMVVSERSDLSVKLDA